MYTEECTIATRDDIDIMRDKAGALDQLLADIKAGLVRIVPMPPTAEMLNEFDYYPRQVDLEDDFRMAIGLAPAYEPLKQWLGC